MTPIDQPAIVARVRSGEHCPIRWARVPWGRVVLHVGEDALSLGGVRQSVTATTAQRLADLLGCTLPTPEIVDVVHAAAAVRCRPCIQAPGPGMASVAAMELHSREVGAQIAGRVGLASTVGKEWVLSSRLSPSVAANYGWPDTRAPNGRIWQDLGHRHNAQHVDYSQVFRPVARACLADGAPADLHDVLRARGWTVLRQPGVPELEAVDVAPGPAADTIPAPPPARPRGGTALSLAVLDAARAVLACGYLETPPGSNRHPWIDAVLRVLGVPVGSSYCAAGATYCLREATRATGLPMPAAGSAGARALLEQFRSAGRSLPPERWAEVYPGCLAFWPRGKGWQGHVGIVEEVRGDGGLACVEFNAKPAEVAARVVHPGSEVRLGFGLV